MNWLCRMGWHWWEEQRVVSAEDYATIHYDDDVCTRCGKLRDPEMALEAYYMMRANIRTKTVKFTTHPSLGLTTAAGGEGSNT